MKTSGGFTMKITRTAACLVFVLLALNGCTDNRQSFFIRFVGVPSGEDCAVPSDRNAVARSAGVLDVGVKGSYFLALLVENAMSSSTALNPITAESNRVTVTGAQVRLSTETGERLGGGDFFVPFSATVDPGNVQALAFTAIPEGYASSVTAGTLVIIETKILGTTGGGLEIDTPWFSFPVYTCNGCTADWGSAAWNSTDACWDCTGVQQDTSAEEQCAIGQDEWTVECCFSNAAYCVANRCPGT